MEDEDTPTELESLVLALSCPICKDVLDGPVSPQNCTHLFCSACIRSSLDHNQKLNQKQICPTCREPCKPNELRRQDVVREAALALPAAVKAFNALRRACEDAAQRAESAERELAELRAAMAARASAPAAPRSAHVLAAQVNPTVHSSDRKGRVGQHRRTHDGLGASNTTGHGIAPGVTSALGGPANSPLGRSLAAAADDEEEEEEDEGEEDASTDSRPRPTSHSLRRQARRPTKRHRRGADADVGQARGQGLHDCEMGSEEDEGEDGDEDENGDGQDLDDEDYCPSPSEGGRPGRPRKSHRPSQKQRQQHNASVGRKRSRAGGRSIRVDSSDGSDSDKMVDKHGSASRGAAEDGRAVGSVGPGSSAEPGAADGMEPCPLCNTLYPLTQLQAHAEICLTRKGLGGVGTQLGGRAGAWGNGTRQLSGGAPAAAAAAGPGPLQVAAGMRRPSPPSVPGPGKVAAAAPPAAPIPAARPPTDVNIPAARNWHQMKDKDARALMAKLGLMDPGSKPAKMELADRYNRYRSFLQAERDRATTLTMDQLLRAFLQKERLEDANRRQPAAAPAWLQASIRKHQDAIRESFRRTARQAAAAATATQAEGGEDREGDAGEQGPEDPPRDPTGPQQADLETPPQQDREQQQQQQPGRGAEEQETDPAGHALCATDPATAGPGAAASTSQRRTGPVAAGAGQGTAPPPPVHVVSAPDQGYLATGAAGGDSRQVVGAGAGGAPAGRARSASNDVIMIDDDSDSDGQGRGGAAARPGVSPGAGTGAAHGGRSPGAVAYPWAGVLLEGPQLAPQDALQQQQQPRQVQAQRLARPTDEGPPGLQPPGELASPQPQPLQGNGWPPGAAPAPNPSAQRPEPGSSIGGLQTPQVGQPQHPHVHRSLSLGELLGRSGGGRSTGANGSAGRSGSRSSGRGGGSGAKDLFEEGMLGSESAESSGSEEAAVGQGAESSRPAATGRGSADGTDCGAAMENGGSGDGGGPGFSWTSLVDHLKVAGPMPEQARNGTNPQLRAPHDSSSRHPTGHPGSRHSVLAQPLPTPLQQPQSGPAFLHTPGVLRPPAGHGTGSATGLGPGPRHAPDSGLRSTGPRVGGAWGLFASSDAAPVNPAPGLGAPGHVGAPGTGTWVAPGGKGAPAAAPVASPHVAAFCTPRALPAEVAGLTDISNGGQPRGLSGFTQGVKGSACL